MHLAKEVLREMKLKQGMVDTSNYTIQASRGWGFLNPPREVEIIMYADNNRVEVAVNVESQLKVLDFGTSDYIEEEFLLRLNARLN